MPDGEAGELYSCTPYTFDGYWKLPEKTREAFRGDYCSVGDMARRDADGYIHLVDRKSNMIISGGENIYPSEVEAVLGAHPAVKDVAVVGLPDAKWGERVHAVVVLRDGALARRGRAARLVPGPARRLQAPALLFFRARGRDAAQRHGQGAAPGAQGGPGRRSQPDDRSRTMKAHPDSVAGLVARALKRRGVERVFALCGGHIMPIWMRLDAEGIRIVDVRDERAAVHMAQAHAELTGELGVALVTAGPGVTNAMTGIANAHVSRAPVLVLSGASPRPQENRGGLQDIDHTQLVRSITRYARTVRETDAGLGGAGRGDLARLRRGRRARPRLHRLSHRHAARRRAEAAAAGGAPPRQAARRRRGPTRSGSPRPSTCCGRRGACS